jgi:hypothetical protein
MTLTRHSKKTKKNVYRPCPDFVGEERSDEGALFQSDEGFHPARPGPVGSERDELGPYCLTSLPPGC